VEVRDIEVWELVDRRLADLRALPYAELRARASRPAEVEVLERPSGRFRRRTRVVALPHGRMGLTVAVRAEGERPRAERAIIITSSGDLAPEWSFRGDPPPRNPFAFRTRTIVLGALVAALLMAVFLLLAGGTAGR
jgi:hypothetical protein